METRELRIGNFILLPDDTVIAIPIILDWRKHKFKPITLTEEWFLKFEFEKNGNRWRWKHGFHFIEVDTYSFYINGFQITMIDKVHLFQNLFFALTGQELTIKQS